MITERTIVNFLMWVGGLILGSYLAATAAAENYWPLFYAGLAVFPFITFGVRDRLCTFPMLGGFISGRFNFIPLGFSAADIFAFALILDFVVNYLVLRRGPMKMGPPYFFLPILILFLIVLYHDHSFGLHAFGGAMEGSRPGVLILVASIAYLCGINFSTPSVSFLKNLPWYGLMLVCLSGIPYLLSSAFPSLTPYLYIVTDNVDLVTYQIANSKTGSVQDMGRNGALAAVGGTLMTCLLCYYPINTWWRPNRWFAPILALGCTVLVLQGGYRNGLVSFVIGGWLCIWCYLSWRALVFLPILGVAFLALSVNQDYHMIDLPLDVQRSLSILPAKWDQEVVDSASSSDDFRTNIRDVYIKEYLYKSPWFGNGVSYDAAKFYQLGDMIKTQETPDHYYQAEQFITGKMFHTGWISLYDIVGLVGSAAFIFLNLSIIWVATRLVFSRNVDRQSPLFPLKVWMFTNSVASFFGFFTLFGDFKTAFPSICYFLIILVHVDKIERESHLKTSFPLPHHSRQTTKPRSLMPVVNVRS